MAVNEDAAIASQFSVYVGGKGLRSRPFGTRPAIPNF